MRRWLRRILLGAIVLLVSLVVVAAAIVSSMRVSVAQRHLGEIITALAQSPGHFFVRVGNVSGNPPWNVRVDKVEIGDSRGVWMVIEDAEADWHPFELWQAFDDTHLRINVDRVHARRLLWTRLPVDDNDPDDKPFRWDRFPRILAGDLSVDEFEVGEGLLGGGHAVLRAHGNGILGEWEHGRLDLALERIDGKRGSAKIDLYSDGSPPNFHGSVTVDEEAAGAMAYMGRLREAGPVQIRVETSGPLRDWNASAVVNAGAIGKLDAKTHIAFGPSGAIRISGTFDPVALQRDRYLVGAGAPLVLNVAGAWIPDHELRVDEGRLDADGRVLHARGRLDLAAADRPYELAATLSREAASDAAAGTVELGPMRLSIAKLDARGRLGLAEETKGNAEAAMQSATIGATLEVEDFVVGDFAFARMRGALDGERQRSEDPLLFNIDVRGADLALRGEPAPLLGAAPWLRGRGEAAVTDGVVTFERVELGGDDLGVDGTLSVDDDWRGLRASLSARSNDLASLSAWVGGGVGGAAELGLELDSKARGDVFEGRVDGNASDLHFGDPGLQALFGSQLTLSAQADGKLRGPATAKASVDAEGIRADAEAELQQDGRTLSGTFSAALDNLARLSDRAAASVAGRLETSGELHGTLDDFSLRGDLSGSQLAYDGMRFDSLTADVSASGFPHHGDGEVHASASYGELRAQLSAHGAMPDASTLVLSDVKVQGPGTEAGGDLRVGLEDGALSGSVKIACQDLSRWRAFLGHGFGGRLMADLSITPVAPGKSGWGVLSGTVSLADGSFASASGEAIVVKSLEATAQALSLGAAPQGQAHAALGGTRIAGVTVEKATLEVQADAKRWNLVADAAGTAGTPWTLSTRASLAAKFAAQSEQHGESGLSANIDAFDLTLGSDLVHLQEPTTAAWTPNSLALAATTLRLGESGKARVSGQRSGAVVRAEVTLEAAPLSLMSILFPDLGLRGSVGGSASLRGSSLTDGVADVHLEGRGLASRFLQDSAAPALDALVDGRFERGRVRGEASLGGLGKERFHLKVDAPLGSGAADRDPVSASLLWHGDLADLAALAPLGEDALKGSVSADLRLGGSVAAPALDGDLSVSGGSYENALTGLVLRDLELKIGAQGSNLVLEKLTATDGEQGRLTATGRAGFARLPAFDAEFDLHAAGATLARLDLITAKADADLSLRLSRVVDAKSVEGAVSGKVKVEEARIRVPDRVSAEVPELTVVEINDVAAPTAARREEQAPALPWNVALDVAVKGNNRVFVEGRGLESEWSPDLHVGGTATDPRVTGLVRSVRGTLDLLGKRFDVTSAELRFDGSPQAIPYLTLTAQSQANDITAIVVANGPATTPTIELRSDPALPSDDVLARLLFGRSATGLTPMQSVQVAQSLAELTGISLGGGPGLLGKLGRTLGLDRLGLEAGSGTNAGSALTASKYLTDKVYLRVQQGLTPQDSKVSVEWEVYKRLRIESDISQDAQGEVGASWQWDY